MQDRKVSEVSQKADETIKTVIREKLKTIETLDALEAKEKALEQTLLKNHGFTKSAPLQLTKKESCCARFCSFFYKKSSQPLDDEMMHYESTYTQSMV